MALAPFAIDDKEFLKQNVALPALPTTLMQVLQVIHSKTTGAAEVTELVGRDAAMASHILRVVNSAYYALPKRIGDIQHAVAYLGLGEVSRICLTLSVINSLKPRDRAELQHFWRHSYLTALIAKRLAGTFGAGIDGGELYSAALLHDVGQLVYQRFFPDHFSLLRQYCREKRCFLVDAEASLGFPSHLTLGALLAEHWGLPPAIRRACSFHELSDLKALGTRAEADPFDFIITVANLIAELSTGELDDPVRDDVLATVQGALEISKVEFVGLLAEVYELQRRAESGIGSLMG
jgi:putative nucleotidyltransferase with HDIG domain